MRNRILICGYHGMRNTGADARLLAIRDAVCALVPTAEIVVPSVHPTNLRYVENVTHTTFHPATYPWALKRHIENTDLMILSEGNMLTDEFSAHLMKAFVTAIFQAKSFDRPIVGMALDSGKLDRKYQPRVCDALNATSLLTVRSAGAKTALQEMGVKRPLEVTADCAVSMRLLSDEETQRVRREAGLDGEGAVHGIAPVDFYMWPARISLFGRKDDYVRYPFRGTWPDGGRARSETLADQWAAFCDFIMRQDPKARVALISMEAVDERFCRKIRERLAAPERTLALSCTALTPKRMSACLGALSSLVTSRYHALLLSMAHAVPYIALGHDTRTKFISEELGLAEYYLSHANPNLLETLFDTHNQLLKDAERSRELIRRGMTELRAKDRRNYELLGQLLDDMGYRVNGLPDSLFWSPASAAVV